MSREPRDLRHRRMPELRILPGGVDDEPDRRPVVICKPRAWGPAAVRSYLQHCATCRAGVWLSVRAPLHSTLRIVCTPCGLAELAALEARGVEPAVEVAEWYEDDERARRAEGLAPTRLPATWAGRIVRPRDPHEGA
jgi:hypothetical protein